MMKKHRFKVAELQFDVVIPKSWDASKLIPSFYPFIIKDDGDDPAFTFTIESAPLKCDGVKELIEVSDNDMGHMSLHKTSDKYWIDISYTEIIHEMTTDANFSQAFAYVDVSDQFSGMVLTSLLRVMFSMALIRHNGVSIHSSCVVKEGQAYLFLGKSGTGKSTHARQWMKAFPGCSLLNDDNPAIRIIDNKVIVFGTPWSGKTPCYKNESHIVKAIVKLRQAPRNCFKKAEEILAFTAILPSCSGIRRDDGLRRLLHENLINISMGVTVGEMDCLPDEDAARVCFEGITSNS